MLGLALASCTQKEQDPVATMKGMFYAGVTGTDEVVEITPGKSKTFDLRAYADKENGGVSDIVLTMSFKADPDAVASYNQAHGTSYVMCPGSSYEFVTNEVMMPRYGAASTTAKLRISSAGLEDGVTYILPIVVDKVVETTNWENSTAKMGCVLVKLGYVAPDAGTGTVDDPYNIYTKADLLAMGEKLEEGKKTYFRLMEDIDMTDVTWMPLNFASPYKLLIDFNGNGHKILNFSCDSPNYPSFFGVLYGKCYDLTFENARIVSEAAAACGVVGGYCGTTDLPGECKNVHVTGGDVYCSANVRGVGGLFGRVNFGEVKDSSYEGKVTQEGGATGTGGICGWLNGTIERCWVNAEVSSNANYAGGITGYDNAQSVIKDCYSMGTVTNGQRAGGIAGGLLKAGTEVRNCYSTMTVIAPFCIGGIAGHCNLDKGSGDLPSTTEALYVVENCIAWNEALTATNTDDSEHYSSGAITGYTSTKSYLTNCYRKADLVFTECASQSDNVLYDQPNATPENPLIKANGTKTYNYPYHGKAAGAGVTLTSVAKSLGWSESVWDLSGDVPLLKAAKPSGGSDEPEDVSAGGQLPDFDENEFYK